MSTSTTTSEEQLQSFDEIEQAAIWLSHAARKEQALLIVERTLTGVERAVCGRLPKPSVAGDVAEALQRLHLAIDYGDMSLIKQIQAEIKRAIQSWRASIVTLDDRILPQEIRRFFERADETLDTHVFEALTRFYRSIEHTNLTQSKYDLIVTRLFSDVDEGDRRTLHVEREDLMRLLQEMFAEWESDSASIRSEIGDTVGEELVITNDTHSVPSFTDVDVLSAIFSFDNFIDEVIKIRRFEDLIKCDLFSRISLYKNNLGTLFYHPEITAAVIECNVILGNKFSSLIEEEGEQIRTAPTKTRQFVNILNVTAPVEAFGDNYGAESLPFFTEDTTPGGRLQRLMRLMQITSISGQEFADTEAKAPEPQTKPHTANAEESSAQVLQKTLRDLETSDENKRLIADFAQMWRSREVLALDLVHFLAPLPNNDASLLEGEAATRRESLSLILQADTMLCTELGSKRALRTDIEERLTHLVEQMQIAGGTLRKLMKVANEQEQQATADALHYISNHILGTRLRLQSAIVQSTAQEIARRKDEIAERKIEKAKQHQLAAEDDRQKRVRSSRLTMVAIVAIVISIALPIANRRNAAQTQSAESRTLQLAPLPDSNLLINSQFKQGVMIGVVSEDWRHLPEHSKREKLQQWLRYGEHKNFKTVTLLNERGLPIAKASAQEISIAADAPSSGS